MNKSAVIIAVVIILVGVGGFLFLNNRSTMTPTSTTPSKDNSMMMESSPSSMAPNESISTDSAVTGMGSAITVESNGLKFTPKEIRIKKGQMVKLTYKNNMGKHNLTIDEFKVATKTIDAGQSETIEFLADKAGTFEYYCSISGHRAAGMVGNLIVE